MFRNVCGYFSVYVCVCVCLFACMCVRVKAEDLLALNETLVNVKIGNPTLVAQVPQIHHCHHIMHVCIYICV